MNENCLEGMACPKCGSEGPFHITCVCTAKVYDDGVSETTDHEWDSNSVCYCEKCGTAASVGAFRKIS